MSNLDLIRREARREAWYSDSMNPFRKVSRSSTAPPPQSSRTRDPELGEEGISSDSPLSNIQTAPGYPTSQRDEEKVNERDIKAEEERLSKAQGASQSSNPESANTIVASTRQSTTAGSDEAPRRRNIKFWQRKQIEEDTLNENGEEKEKKRAWYKGKVLPHKEPFTVRNQLQRTIFGSWINILLLAAPAGIACNYAGVSGVAVFCVNFIAIVPLAGMLGFATEEIALHVGESLGGLLNATFG
jgi:Ca2+:H+ antiporter